jgi:AcrR family transcriptional regulator
VSAAGRLFAERGFHGTSMRDLGSELGLLGSSLYSHVAGKNELLVEVIRRGSGLFQGLADGVMAEDLTPLDRLERLIRGHVAIVIDHLDHARTFLNEARFLPPEERAEVVEMRNRYERTFRRVIEDGIAAGEFREGQDPTMAAILILSVLNALVRWYRPTGPTTAAQIADDMVEFVMKGIA